MPNAKKLVDPFRVSNGKKFRLKDYDPNDTGRIQSKEHARVLLEQGIARLSELQEKLYAQDRWSLLLIFQAMDAAGKDSTIKHVMSGINPQGCQVYSFKAPSGEELDHDFLWRTTCRLPERGRIGIFNRSYYEEVLIVRVHPEFLKKQKLPVSLITENIWQERFEDINAFERYLSRNGVVIRKFFLHASKEEQRKRFLERLEEPEKHWKFALPDVQERQHWDEYMRVYEDMIQHTSSSQAPWYVVPADRKWFTRLVVAAAIVETLEGLGLAYPEADERHRKDLETAREVLIGEGQGKK
ncbi:MAG: polyphosphate kinase 2 family protein [Candidatus Binatia bacterium]